MPNRSRWKNLKRQTGQTSQKSLKRPHPQKRYQHIPKISTETLQEAARAHICRPSQKNTRKVDSPQNEGPSEEKEPAPKASSHQSPEWIEACRETIKAANDEREKLG